MTEILAPVSKDSPLWRAWEAYTATEDYANTKLWASRAEHAEGSLWAAFQRGFAAQPIPAPVAGKADEMPEVVAMNIRSSRESAGGWRMTPGSANAAIVWLADDRERLIARVEELERQLRNVNALAGEPILYVPTRLTTHTGSEDTNASR